MLKISSQKNKNTEDKKHLNNLYGILTGFDGNSVTASLYLWPNYFGQRTFVKIKIKNINKVLASPMLRQIVRSY